MTYDELCKHLHPADYVEGVGLSAAGEKVAARLALADEQTIDDPVADNSWGHLTAEALAEDEWQFRHMMHEGKL